MSLTRTALRLAAIEALNADPTIDALCVGRIYDSRIGDIASDEVVPVITIYTEDASGPAYSANNGGPPFNETCELLIEIAMRMVVPGGPDDVIEIGVVESDRQIEAMLDLLEHRVVEAVTIASTPQSATVRHVTRRVSAFKSVRFASDETAVKLAIRMLHLTTELKSYADDDPRDLPTGPFAALPEPLRTVALSMPAGSSGLETCTKLASSIADPPSAATFLTGMDIVVVPRLAIDRANPPTLPGGGPTVAVTADIQA